MSLIQGQQGERCLILQAYMKKGSYTYLYKIISYTTKRNYTVRLDRKKA